MHFDKSVFGRNLPRFENIIVEGTEIEIVGNFKYLGFLIDNKLNFSYQVNHCFKQVNH